MRGDLTAHMAVFAALGLCACEAAPLNPTTATTTRSQAIRNGTREPTVVPLTEGQKLAIGWLHEARYPEGNLCTGTLIGPDVVVTASHCTQGRSASQLGFGVGLTPSERLATFSVSSIHEHPTVDAAILLLSEDATARLGGLTPIRVNGAALTTALEGIQIEVAGYGETYDPGRDGRWFAALELELVGPEYITVNGGGLRGLCYGDSGGPLLSTLANGLPVLLAVESRGEASCLGRDEMTRLDVIQEWMVSVAGPLPIGGGTTELDPDPCRGLDHQGRCVSTEVQWCENGQLKKLDCAQDGRFCDYVEAERIYTCTETAPEVSVAPPCTAADNLCDGFLRYVCSNNGSLIAEDCSLLDGVCTFNSSGEPICAVPEPDERRDVGGGFASDTDDDGLLAEPTVVKEGCSAPGRPNQLPLAALLLLLPLLRGARRGA